YVGRVGATGGPVEKLSAGKRVIAEFSPGADGALAVNASTATEPPEIHALENGQLRRLTQQNDEWTKDIQFATTEDFTATAKDGTVVNSLLTKPAGYQAGKNYPLYLLIHGRPNGQD